MRFLIVYSFSFTCIITNFKVQIIYNFWLHLIAVRFWTEWSLLSMLSGMMMRRVADMTVLEEGDMGDPPVQFIVDDQVLTMVVHAVLSMIGTMDHQPMTGEGALIMVGLGARVMVGPGVLNMVEPAGIVFGGCYLLSVHIFSFLFLLELICSALYFQSLTNSKVKNLKAMTGVGL